MKDKHLDVFEKIVRIAEKIREAQEKRIQGDSESKDKNCEVDIQ